ncbi:hypothetical protein CGCS363_v002520 [Colletotrichum siamense]|uniref:uncharacterized protein n=1 Tax=Colletotrichum siamense TaxID=690259 RepID=UPI00187339EF|nr:uncharacterized protein CGCS363_v002520 [Colletotrichum siamense]KAF5511556.1 hypothetical protein CGCS363_v002520 [Colletotrichum siamense]
MSSERITIYHNGPSTPGVHVRDESDSQDPPPEYTYPDLPTDGTIPPGRVNTPFSNLPATERLVRRQVPIIAISSGSPGVPIYMVCFLLVICLLAYHLVSLCMAIYP